MTLDNMLWPFLSGLLASIAFALITFSRTAVAKAVARRKLSKLPKSRDTSRAIEELEGFLESMTAAERLELAAGLIVDPKRLSAEIGERCGKFSTTSGLAKPNECADSKLGGYTFFSRNDGIVVVLDSGVTVGVQSRIWNTGGGISANIVETIRFETLAHMKILDEERLRRGNLGRVHSSPRD